MEVPAGLLAGLGGELLEQGRGTIARDLGFGEHRELHAKGTFAKGGDVLVAAFFLRKVVRGKAQNHQATVFVLGVQRFQAFVLRGETAKTGGVNHQHHLARVLTE